MNKKLFLMVTIFITAVLAWAVVTYAAAPKAYVTYSNPSGNSVVASIYWKDTGGYSTVQWASAMNASGSDLNWLGLTPQGSSPDRWVSLTTNQYMNYYVKISDGNTVTDDTYVRMFPVAVPYLNPMDPNVRSRVYNDYAHGNFRPDTPMCGGCHSTHSALKAQLLKKATYYELCMLCHSNANSQSKYDVEAGKVSTVNGYTYDSLAGPISSLNGAVSMHNADDTGGLTPMDVPGSEVTSGTNKLSLTCISCHNGHGGTNDNYRLLKKKIYASDNQTIVTNNVYYNAFAITASASSGETLSMVSGNTEFCSACHLDYYKGNAWNKGGQYNPVYTSVYMHPVSVGSTVYSVTYNYAVNAYSTFPLGLRSPSLAPAAGDILPLQFNPKTDAGTDKRTAVVCSTCHFAHGSTKNFGFQNINQVQTSDQVYESRYMLRLDNYGVCESCHKK